MSITTSRNDTDFEQEMTLATADDIEFEQLQGILHGEYQQARGTLSLNKEYDITVTERDNNYHIQVRGPEGVEQQTYVESENPYQDLPEDSNEMYDLLREDLLE